MKLFVSLILAALTSLIISGQEALYYLQEGFEVPEERALWASTPIDPIIYWDYQLGGDNNLPPYAYEGSNNAFFGWYDAGGPTVRILESPPINLSDARRPQLVFAHAQHVLLTFQDELRVLFKAGSSADWDTIETYTNNITSWTEHTFNIEEFGTEYLVEDFQLGFMASGKGGNGVCIDSVTIEEKDIIHKFVRTFSIEQVEHSVVPTEVEDIPVLKLYLEVFGNTDTLVLNSISFTSNSTNDTDFPASGFNLYHTRGSIFRNEYEGSSTQVGPSVSINSGVVTFSGLDFDLRTGDNYLWLTADIDSAAGHGNIIDFLLQANSISISDTLLPGSTVNPSGELTINESVLFDNFELSSGWTLGGDFEIDTPQGFTINIATDPDFAYSGSKVLGTDLITDGGYTPGIIPATAYFAVSPTVNLKYYKEIKLYAQKWLSFSQNDEITIDISLDGGSNWSSIWDRKKDLISFNESSWSEFFITDKINNIAATESSVTLRLAMNETHPSYILGGWNLDNFAIVGNHIDVDVGVIQLLSPYDDCLGKFNDTVKVVIRNYAEGPSPTNIPIYYSLEGFGGSRIYDTIPGPIAKDDSVVFTFSTPADFQNPGSYDFIVSIDLTSDEDNTNDTISKPIFIQNSVSVPYYEDFETNEGYWLPSKSSTWKCVEPTGGIPPLEGSPNSWFVSTALYLNSDTSWVTSSCYDLVSDDILVAELNYWSESDTGIDGANIQYSVDGGQSWQIIDSSEFGLYSNWFTEDVTAIGEAGWSGNTSDWVTAREYLPVSLTTEPNVKFRAYWSSDASIATGRGFAFDNFNVYPAPPDVGVSALITPADACQLVNDGSVTLDVTNYGINKLRASDTIIIGVDLDGNPTMTDTVQLVSDLLPGNTVQLTLDIGLDLSTAKTYSISAFTLMEDYPYFYDSVSNDTLSTTFTIWANPVTELPDTLFSREPQNLIIRPYETTPPGYTFLWFDMTTADTHTVSLSEMYYSVTVTEPDNSCQTDDSVYVLLLYYDVGTDSIISPVTNCDHSSSELIQIQVRNFGTDSLLVDDEIAVAYQVDGGSIYTDTISLTESFLAGKTITHTFTGEPYDFSGIGTYNIKTWANYIGGDSTATNDTTADMRETYGYTSLELGPDSISVKALGHTLDAGAGFVSYLWNNDSTTRTISLNTAGTYWVNAVDANGCPGQDTIYVWLKIRDVMADAMLGPQTQCERSSPVSVQLQVYNNGTDTLQSGDVTVSYRINGGALVQETAGNVSDILPGSAYTHTFTAQEDLSAYQTYNFDLTATSTGDLRSGNDNISASIKTNPDPVIDFGLGEYVVVDAATFEVDAGLGTNYTYMWQDGITTTRKYTATATGDVYCTVTNSLTGCTGYDEVYLQFRVIDYEVFAATLSNSPCGGENTGTVDIYNRGTNVTQGGIFTVSYELNNEAPVEELFNVDVPSGWVPGSKQQITLSNNITISGSGANTLKIYFKDSPDAQQINDTLTMNLNISQSPVVDFGGDTLGVQFPYTLVAGSDNSNVYSWSVEGVGNVPAITITEPDNYSVTVVGSNGCITSKSVVVEHGSYINTAAQENLYVKLYPNPANNYLNVEANLKYGGQVLIELYDITNRILFSDTHKGGDTYNRKIDVDALSKGMYFIRFSNKEIYRVDKIIVR